MAYWLFKEEPEHYSFDDLQRDGRTEWDGVRNALAQQYLRQVRRGDRVLLYHTGKEKAVVGIMRVVKGAYPDPTDEKGRRVLVDVAPVRRLKSPVTLAQIKANPKLQGMLLVKIPRLSVMPVSEEEWAEILSMAGEKQSSPKK